MDKLLSCGITIQKTYILKFEIYCLHLLIHSNRNAWIESSPRISLHISDLKNIEKTKNKKKFHLTMTIIWLWWRIGFLFWVKVSLYVRIIKSYWNIKILIRYHATERTLFFHLYKHTKGIIIKIMILWPQP